MGASSCPHSVRSEPTAPVRKRKGASGDLPEGGVLQEERSRVRVATGYQRTLTRRFFGLGDDTEEHDETSYSDEYGLLDVGLGFPVHPDIVPESPNSRVMAAGLGMTACEMLSGLPASRRAVP